MVLGKQITTFHILLEVYCRRGGGVYCRRGGGGGGVGWGSSKKEYILYSCENDAKIDDS